MGSVQSYLSSQTTTLILVVAGVVTYSVAQKLLLQQQQFQPPSSQSVADSAHSAVSGTSASKKSKKKKQVAGASHQPADAPSNVQPNVVAFPGVVPGSFEPSQSAPEGEPSSAPKPTKSKKKKGKKPVTAGAAGGSRNVTTEIDVQSDSSATAPESHPSSSSRPKKKSPAPKSTSPSTSLLDTDGPWTRVEPKKRTAPQHQQDQSSTSAVGEGPSGGGGVTTTTSDAGVTTSVTGNSSPVAERTEDESHSREGTSENRRTLAEKLVPKPRKTGVDELSVVIPPVSNVPEPVMLETPDVPSLARVMRVQPRPDEQPAAGFTWGDYEDVDDSRMTADDADGEDEGGWVVKSSRTRVKPKADPSQQPPSAPQRAPESLTKKQRQNLARKEAQKGAKNAAETERLQTLARHKRELEKARMLEQHTSGSKKQPGGGMNATLNEKGQLVWE